MSVPRFSVILIAFNQQKYVGAALESVLSSSFIDLEVVCVDDGSSDGTLGVLHEVGRRDPRVTVLSLPHSGKPGKSRNTGLENARGEFITFLDGDDLVDPDRFALLDEAIRRTDGPVHVLLHDYATFPDGHPLSAGTPRLRQSPDRDRFLQLGTFTGSLANGVATWAFSARNIVQFMMTESFVPNTGTVCIRRSHFDARAGGFPEDRVLGEDNIVWLKCILDAEVVYLDAVLFFWRKYLGSLTSVRTPGTQREVIRSMREMAALAAPSMDGRLVERMRQREFEEALYIGYILERSGARWGAVRDYAATAWQFRRIQPLVRAMKALVRRPK